MSNTENTPANALLKAPHEYLAEALQSYTTQQDGSHARIPECVALAALEAMYNDFRAAQQPV